VIISVHLPKTAGMSFGLALNQVFGDKLLSDYDDLPINTEPYLRNLTAFKKVIQNADNHDKFKNISCIHGHYLPIKYLLLNEFFKLKFVTWMRHPVDRIISHYYFWQHSYNPSVSAPLHKKVVEQKWSLEKFCLSEELKNLYSQFLFGFPLYNFDFIGISEFYREDLEYFSREFLGIHLPYYQANKGKNEKNQYDIDHNLYEMIKSHHKEDFDLYFRALEMRKNRI